jgi:hypothetical protein
MGRSQRQVEVADDRVVDELDAGAVNLDAGATGHEFVASGGQPPDEVREAPILGVGAGFGAQQGDCVLHAIDSRRAC